MSGLQVAAGLEQLCPDFVPIWTPGSVRAELGRADLSSFSVPAASDPQGSSSAPFKRPLGSNPAPSLDLS